MLPQNVGIGTASPSAPMDVVSNSSAIGTRIRGRSADSYGVLEFTNNSASAETARIAADTSGNIIFSNTGSVTERMRILAGAPILSLAGGSTSATGTGIAFPATQSASTDANTLDDYEEGTFTPTIVGVSTVGTATYTVQTGKYTKIGDRVLINIYLQWTGGTGAGNMDISGLPFSSESSVANQSLSNYNSGIAMTAGHVMQLITGASSIFINVNSIPTGGGSDVNVPYDSAGLIIVGGSYRAA
jgi:hypothetical protein